MSNETCVGGCVCCRRCVCSCVETCVDGRGICCVAELFCLTKRVDGRGICCRRVFVHLTKRVWTGGGCCRRVLYLTKRVWMGERFPYPQLFSFNVQYCPFGHFFHLGWSLHVFIHKSCSFMLALPGFSISRFGNSYLQHDSHKSNDDDVSKHFLLRNSVQQYEPSRNTSRLQQSKHG